MLKNWNIYVSNADGEIVESAYLTDCIKADAEIVGDFMVDQLGGSPWFDYIVVSI